MRKKTLLGHIAKTHTTFWYHWNPYCCFPVGSRSPERRTLSGFQECSRSRKAFCEKKVVLSRKGTAIDWPPLPTSPIRIVLRQWRNHNRGVVPDSMNLPMMDQCESQNSFWFPVKVNDFIPLSTETQWLRTNRAYSKRMLSQCIFLKKYFNIWNMIEMLMEWKWHELVYLLLLVPCLH